MKKKKKILIIAAIALVLVIVVVVNILKSGEKTYQVQAEKVKKTDITSIVTANGKIAPRTDVKISAYVPAKVIQLPVKEGDLVKKGQLLVQLDESEYRAAVNQAKAQLSSAQANLKQAQLTYDRQMGLFEKKLSSKEQYDLAETELQRDKALVDQATASLEQTQYDLDKTTITSPIDGMVTSLVAEVGEIVMIGTMNNPGTVIMTVSDMSLVEAEVEVDETDIADVKLDQEAKIKIDAYPDTTFRGKVGEIGQTGTLTGVGTQDQVTNFLVKVTLLDTVPTIRPGMSTTVDITTNRRTGVLGIPIQAVVMREEKGDTVKAKKEKTDGALASVDSTSRKKDQKAKKEVEGVFVIENGRAKFAKVKTGVADQQNIEIVSGLKEDDMLVTGTYKILRTLKDGDKVKISRKPEAESVKPKE
ncbi:MAG: efflux RND transporter periplasmic adaptor subunit [Candidatus Zixiibacteriota bacterium]